MKEILAPFAAYNSWANGLLLDVITGLPEEKQKLEINSSFNSLFLTVLHMLDANSIWWQRLKLQERIIRPSEEFSGDMKKLAGLMKEQDSLWVAWINNASEPQLQHEFKYQNSKRESFKQPIYEMLLHLFNHATYHRGPLVTMLRQAGVEKIPPTDFIVWSRK
jgi:uncharacterized damage-inducible protein DinB